MAEDKRMYKTTKDPMPDMSEANCVSSDPNLFFPSGQDMMQMTRTAKSICAECDIVERCLEYALKNVQWGIWGGTTQPERNILKKQPRKIPLYIQLLKETKGGKDLVRPDALASEAEEEDL